MSEVTTTGTPQNSNQGETVLTAGMNPTAAPAAATPPANPAASGAPANNPAATQNPAPGATTEQPSGSNGNEPAKTNQAQETILTQKQKVVPEKYDLKLPKDSALNPEVLTHIAEQAKASGMSNEEAQAEVERENQAVSRYTGDLMKRMTEQKTAWVQGVHSDPEIGGKNFDKAISNAQRALHALGTPQLVQELNRTGYGNHPELIRILARVGSKMDDDSAVLPGASGGQEQRAGLDVLYDKQPKK